MQWRHMGEWMDSSTTLNKGGGVSSKVLMLLGFILKKHARHKFPPCLDMLSSGKWGSSWQFSDSLELRNSPWRLLHCKSNADYPVTSVFLVQTESNVVVCGSVLHNGITVATKFLWGDYSGKGEVRARTVLIY
jgi:hypothetical protein